MAISYLSGNRATGTASDRTGLTTYSAKSWVELGRTTLSSSSTTIDLNNLSTADYPYLKIIFSGTKSGGNDVVFRLNNNQGGNYAYREIYNGSSSENPATGQNQARFFGGSNSVPMFWIGSLSNNATHEKLIIGHGVHSTGNGVGSINHTRSECFIKWANTSDNVESVNVFNLTSGNFDSGAEVILLGSKSSGTNTDKAGFWQELADVELSSVSEIDSGAITSKKYLWIEFSGLGSSGSSYPRLRFNSDDQNNFCYRQSIDGVADNEQLSQNHMNTTGNVGAFNHFFTAFVVNDSSKEKLAIIQGVDSNTSGQGNAPRRREVTGKWNDTSNAITSVQVLDLGSNNFTSARLKVWGAD